MRYTLDGGYMAVEGDYLVFAGTDQPGSAEKAQCMVISDPAATAAVLLELAKTVLERTNAEFDTDITDSVLLEAGLLRAEKLSALKEPLKDASSLGASPNNLGLGLGLGLREVEVNNHQPKETGKLKGTVTERLRETGIPADVIRYFGTRDGYVRALNISTNPAKAARTMMAKPKFEGQFQTWLKNNSAPVEETLQDEPVPMDVDEFQRKLASVKVSETDGLESEGESFRVENVSITDEDDDGLS
jgi:hypothetical protein